MTKSRIIRPGQTEEGSLFIKITLTDGKLSLVGVVGPKSNGDARGSCGQNTEKLGRLICYAEGWDAEKATYLAEMWNRWHLNDMRPGCEHQKGPEWDTTKKLDVQTYTQVGTNYDDVEAMIRHGRATPEEIELQALSEKVWSKQLLGSEDPYPEAEIKHLVEANMLAPWKVNQAMAGWVYPYQHPEGLLCKSCPICGYKYGSAWLREEVPAEVIEWIFALPESDTTPAWV